MTRLTAISGASGRLGGGVARRLSERGVPQRLIVRDPSRAPRIDGAEVATADYSDGSAMSAALTGVDTLFLVSATEHADRQRMHAGVVGAAAAAGVRRVVYTSFLAAAPDCVFTFGRDHWHTEQAVRAAGLEFTFLRDSLYQDVLPAFVGDDGKIRGPAGDGRFAPVARDDVADVAVAVLTEDGHEGRTYELTGPRLMTMYDVAAAIGDATGREVSYQPERLDEAYASRAAYGAPRWAVDGWVTSYSAIAAGELDALSDDVATVARHPATDLTDLLRRRHA
jgi:NAD(P)H dehydrogenase (quinone)